MGPRPEQLRELSLQRREARHCGTGGPELRVALLLSIPHITSAADSSGVEGDGVLKWKGTRIEVVLLLCGGSVKSWDTLAVVKTGADSEPLPSLLLKGQPFS